MGSHQQSIEQSQGITVSNADPGTQQTADASVSPHAAHDPKDGTLPLPDPLPALRAEFPAFRIWRETTRDRVRYIARSPHLDLNPHTVVTDDLGELRAALTFPRSAELAAAGQRRP
jgi:hypothetical protein